MSETAAAERHRTLLAVGTGAAVAALVGIIWRQRRRQQCLKGAMRIVGLTGTLGAGKGACVDHLIARGFRHYSVREFLYAELKRRGSDSQDRDALVAVANDLRAKAGPSAIIECILKEAVADGSPAVIESVRTVGEAEALLAKGATLLAVDADRAGRFRRITHRASATDGVLWEKFVADEEREMTNTDPTKQNLSAVIAMSSHIIQNDGSLDELATKLNTLLDADTTSG